jgi:hypothetical protein
MTWWWSDAAMAAYVGLLLAMVGVGVAVLLHFRERYDRNLVQLDERTRVEDVQGLPGQRRAILVLVSTGNRATVVRDIKLVDDKRMPFLSYRRQAEARCVPRLPFRLDAPDELVATLELTDAEEQRLKSIEVELLERTEPIVWPYVRLQGGVIAGRGSLAGQPTVLPTPASDAGKPPTPDR